VAFRLADNIPYLRRLHHQSEGVLGGTLIISQLMEIGVQLFQIATLPLILYNSRQLSLVTLLTNLLILPVQPAVMMWGGLATVAGLIWLPLGRTLGWVAWLSGLYYRDGETDRHHVLCFHQPGTGECWAGVGLLWPASGRSVDHASRPGQAPRLMGETDSPPASQGVGGRAGHRFDPGVGGGWQSARWQAARRLFRCRSGRRHFHRQSHRSAGAH
jgi:hypothetical protein